MSGRLGGRRRTGTVVIGSLILLAAGLSVNASAAPGGPRSIGALEAAARHAEHARARADDAENADDADDSDGDAKPTGPAAELPPANSAVLTGGVGLSTSLRDTRARVNVELPSVTTAVYVDPSSRTPPDITVPATRAMLPRRPDPACDYYVSGLLNDLYIIDVDQPDPDKAGTVRSIGQFPDVRVSTLAFGGLPLTATLHTSQARKNGKVVPLTADDAEVPKSVARGAGADAATGCDPVWEANFTHPVISQGQAVARFSDVSVDGHPVDVGDHCVAASPLQLNLVGLGPNYGGNYGLIGGGTLVQRKDARTVNPANPIAVAPGSTNLTIPPFTGCVGKSGQDFSRLVTTLVSGTDATLAVNQSPVALNNFDPNSPSLAGVEIPPHPKPPAPGR